MFTRPSFDFLFNLAGIRNAGDEFKTADSHWPEKASGEVEYDRVYPSVIVKLTRGADGR